MKLILVILLIPFASFASVDVAFIELKDRGGQVIQLEPDGQFAHIAISYQGRWLHSHPLRGVETITQDGLEKIGPIKAIVTISDVRPLEKYDADRFLGKAYDADFSWTDDKIYCSELVAKLLGVVPQPMTFETKFWPKGFHALRGSLRAFSGRYI